MMLSVVNASFDERWVRFVDHQFTISLDRANATFHWTVRH